MIRYFLRQLRVLIPIPLNVIQPYSPCHMFVLGCLSQKLSPDMIDDEGFLDLLSKFQSRRMDEQRCSFRILPSGVPESRNSAPPAAAPAPVAPPAPPAEPKKCTQLLSDYSILLLLLLLLLLF